MSNTKPPFSLSLTEWSRAHIRRVFEAPTDSEAIKAFDQTFSRGVKAMINGNVAGFAQIKAQVLDMRESSQHSRKGKLDVRWKEIIEGENNGSGRRDGRIGGFYLIEGITKLDPSIDDSENPIYVEFVRYKSVSARIVEEGTASADSRRIVELIVIATDVEVTPNADAGPGDAPTEKES